MATDSQHGSSQQAASRAYEYTKAQILRGALAGGTWLTEGRICDELDMSRTPVHEAFLRLDSEQLLNLSSRKGAIVTPIGPQEGRDLLEIRRAIEMTAAERVIADGHPADEIRAVLDPILQQQDAHMTEGDVDAFAAADDAFHRAVVVLSGNPFTAQFFDLMHDRQQRLRFQLLRIDPANLQRSFVDHGTLADHLAAGSAQEYGAVLEMHIARNNGAL